MEESNRSAGPLSDGGTFFVVGTPIGNLGDLSERMVQVLSSVELVAAEDTRRTRNLLSHLGISVKLISCHEHNEAGSAERIIASLEAGDDVALVTDAGMPALSDPGSRAVRRVRSHGFHVVPVPGPSAVTTALAVSGMSADRFHFEGFLPSKKRARQKRLQALKGLDCTLVFFEAPHRLHATLTDMLGHFGDRETFMARELTKVHETLVSATLSGLLEEVGAAGGVKGEITLVVAGATGPSDVHARVMDSEELKDSAAQLLGAIYKGRRVSMKRVSSIISNLTGIPSSEIYSMALEARDSED